MDIAATGPSPGRTPTNVPNKHPKKQKRKLSSWNINENAKLILEKKSIAKTPKIPLAVEL